MFYDAIDPNKYTKPSEAVIKNILTPTQYAVTQKMQTERAFSGIYYDHRERGIYVDIGTGEPLFSSIDKYDSGSGWASFTKPIDPAVIVEITDESFGMHRTEIKSRAGSTHLGHVFDDGILEKGGRRYCVNSASLRFISCNDLEKAGYAELLPLCGQLESPRR